jgi:hypothetical protein
MKDSALVQISLKKCSRPKELQKPILFAWLTLFNRRPEDIVVEPIVIPELKLG